MPDLSAEQLCAPADSLAILPLTDDDRKHAKAVAYDLAARDQPKLTDELAIGRHALLLLAALGLANPYMPLPGIPDATTYKARNGKHVRRVGATTHGTAVGLAWHKEQRAPACSKCLAWERGDQTEPAAELSTGAA